MREEVEVVSNKLAMLRRAAAFVMVAHLGLAPGLLHAQAPALLTLEDAISQAHRNNPAFLSRSNDTGVTEWGVREAYAGFLPTVTTSGGRPIRGGGDSAFRDFHG